MKYAILHHTSIFHEGDERSRTNPGHGYPTWDEPVTKFLPMEDEFVTQNWLLKNPKEKCTVIQYKVLQVLREVQIELKPFSS